MPRTEVVAGPNGATTRTYTNEENLARDAEEEAFAARPAARRLVPLAVITARLMALNKTAEVASAIEATPELQARFLALEEGIYADDDDARGFLTGLSIDPDAVLGAE